MRIHASRWVHQIIVTAMAIAMLSAVSSTANAQFGLFKKLKHKPDSAAHDSTAVANGAIAPAAVVPTTATRTTPATADSAAATAPAPDTTKKHHSFFGKAISAVGKANNAVEEKTGIDTKSLALNVATGGTYSAVTKAQGLMAAAKSGNPGAAAAALAQSGHKLPFGAKLGVATALTAITPNIGSAFGGTPATAKASGSVNADQRDIVAFQQEMLQVQSQAANGDAGARARLEQWQAISVKYQPQMIEASQRASAGDQNAAKQLADLQMKMIREWRAGGGASSSSKP